MHPNKKDGTPKDSQPTEDPFAFKTVERVADTMPVPETLPDDEDQNFFV